MEDKQLAAAAAQGDQQAFAELFERHRLLVYTIAFKICLDEDDALDITQNVFVRLAAKMASYDGRGSFRGWLCAIASNESFSYLRQHDAP